jgi:Spy/CpxP family protein refolding chaperone
MKALARIGPRRVWVLALLGLVGGIAASTWTGGGPAGAAPEPVGILGRLELSPKQQDRIEQLRERESGWLRDLRCALVRSERELRSAEMQQPFDAKRVNRLVSGQAELIAYLRGAESRIVGDIARLLTPDQQRRFWELRAVEPAILPSEVFSALAPEPGACVGFHVSIPHLPARVAPQRRPAAEPSKPRPSARVTT